MTNYNMGLIGLVILGSVSNFAVYIGMTSKNNDVQKLALAIPCILILSLFGFAAILAFPFDQDQAITFDVLTLVLAICFIKAILSLEQE